jgi:hypothetical protein
MTRKEAERLARQAEVLRSLGFTSEEAEQLRRISMTLHRWHELECGTDAGCIERDEHTGEPFWSSPRRDWKERVADREKGALKRLAELIRKVNVIRAGEIRDRARRKLQPVELGPLSAYIQTDPRGAALYIIRPGDVPAGADVSAHYNRGICVY